MNCINCNNIIKENSKFCGKCGEEVKRIEELLENKIENIPIEESRGDKLEKKVKDTGNFAMTVGGLRFLVAIVLTIVLFTGGKGISFLSSEYYFSDIALNVVEGVIFIILGSRIANDINVKTKKYLWVLIIITSILTVLNLGMGNKPILTILLLIHSINSLSKVKKLESAKKSAPKYKISGWKWLWIIIGSFIFLSIGIGMDIPKDVLSEPTELLTDKNPEYSEITGNMYRNTKYGFRIKFPEGWKIETGDGIHIVQKASSEDGTISVIIGQFDLGNNEGFSSIENVGSLKEIIDMETEGVKSKFSNVKIIDYGETKIDNEPAYWVEYSATSQVLDYEIEMTNLTYFLAKNDTMYSISSGTETSKYFKIKPIFNQSVATFVLEIY